MNYKSHFSLVENVSNPFIIPAILCDKIIDGKIITILLKFSELNLKLGIA